MNAPIQVIERDGKPEWAILPYEVYIKLVEDAEMLVDIRDNDAEKAAIQSGEQELIPAEVTFALWDGNNPVKVWREYRGISHKTLLKGSASVFLTCHSWRKESVKALWKF